MVAPGAAVRICILTETYRPEVGGGETQAELLAEGLISLGFGVSIVTRRSRAWLPAVETAGALVIRRLGPGGPGRYRKWGLGVTAAVELLRHRHEYDLIFVSGFRILGVPAVLAARLQGKPCVLKADSLGELSGEFFRAGLGRVALDPASPPVRVLIGLRNRMLRRADRFVAISSAIRRELAAMGVAAGAIETIPNGIDTTRFTPVGADEKLALRRELAIAPDAIVVLFTGRLVSYKGLPLLVRVWRDLCRQHPLAELLLVGEGGLDMHACEAELRQFVAANGLEGRIRFAGAVPHVERYLKASDVFVFPTENEAFGLSLVEAMACGLPPVSTRAGGLADIVEPDVDGLSIEAGQPDQLAKALGRLLRDDGLRERLGRAAASTARARFASGIVAARYADLFRTLASRGTGEYSMRPHH
jgi:glycosyltransferase involved in cell wall biosynthesis